MDPLRTSRPPRVVLDEVVGGRYRILEELGHGGMSVVYRAHDRLLDRDIALKLLRQSSEDARNLLFLEQEFRAMVRLRHPRLVQVFDYGILDSGSAYFTMELLGGTDLSAISPLPLESVFRVLLSIADVLAFMHARGYVHRDIKPSNVRVLPRRKGQDIEIKLMDCGLTERLGRDNAAVAGTLVYLAPEAWLGAPNDIRGDLYALGVLAYEIAAGQLPFDASTGMQLLKSKTVAPRDLRETRADFPSEFARLVRDLLAPEPANRPASAMEVVARLSEFSDMEFCHDQTVYLRTPALVGRSRELAELRSAFSEANGGRPSPTVIVGPAGAGKTRLLEEALLEAGLRGAMIARATGRGFAGGSYEVLHALLAPLFHLPTAEAALSRIGGKSALGYARHTAARAEVDAAVDPIAVRRALHLSLAAFLGDSARHGLVVFAIDDIHLADAASVDALASVISAGPLGSLAIIATLREGEPISQSLARLLASSRCLTLDRMTREQISELIVGALGPVAPSPKLVEDLERICSGNVYFVLEVLRELAARGRIERQRTRLRLPESLDESELPTNLTEALQCRVARLSPAALQLARLCAVAGRAIDFEFGLELMGASHDEFLDAIDELRREELLDVHGRELRIHHPRLREVLHQELAPAERRVLHAKVAELLRRDGGDEREHAAELGYHFAEAGADRLALDYLVRAGDQRYQRFAYFDAREAYQRAFELLPAAPARHQRELECKLNDRLGRICFYHDHRNGPRFLEHARRAHLRYGLLWAIAPLGRVVGAAAAVAICVTLTALLDFVRVRRRPLTATLARLLEVFAATTYLSNCYTYSGRLRPALDAADRLLPFVYSSKRLPRVGYLMARVYTLVLMNRFDEAMRGANEALAILARDKTTPVSEHDRIHAIGGALVTQLWVDLTRGYGSGSSWWKPLEDFVQEHPTALLESWLMEVRVFAAYRQGRVSETEAAWSRFVEKSSQTEVVFVQSKSKVWLGMAYLDAGRLGEAQDIADEVIRVGRELDNPFILGLGLQLRGMALHAWEQYQDAEACFDEAACLTSQPDVECWELHHSILLSQAALALDRGEPTRAEKLANRVARHDVNQLRRHELHRCRIHQILGKAAMAQGAMESAVRHLDGAKEIALELNDDLERAKVAHCLAKAWAMRGDSRRAEWFRVECCEALTGLDNGYYLRRWGCANRDSTFADGELATLARVMRLVPESSPGQTTEPQSMKGTSLSNSLGADRERSAGSQLSKIYEQTLVAADSTTAATSEK